MEKIINLPDFKIDKSKIPYVRLKSIRFQKFKAFEDHFIDFTNNNTIKPFVCLIGPNGCGKSTILDSIQLIFSRFNNINPERLKVMLGRYVRHTDNNQNGIYGNDDFLITAEIKSSLGDYEIKINKKGFLVDHPENIKMLVYRLCFYARFDQELRTFQLERDKWSLFKELFEAVTGFKIEEVRGVFDQSDDPVQADILNKYVLSFNIHKPDEIIRHTECSSGERKIIKSFSTLLNKDYNPQIILIDNVAMHVESGRHLELIRSMKKCFPNSQIFTTTHSYNISRNFGDRTQLYDLRLIKASTLVKQNPWRLYLADELKDCIEKLKSSETIKEEIKPWIIKGEGLINNCFSLQENNFVTTDARNFMKKVSDFYITDLINYYK